MINKGNVAPVRVTRRSFPSSCTPSRALAADAFLHRSVLYHMDYASGAAGGRGVGTGPPVQRARGRGAALAR